jgi:hypothetical protein
MQLVKCPMPGSGVDLSGLSAELVAGSRPYSLGATTRTLNADCTADLTSGGEVQHETRYVFVMVPDSVTVTTSVRNSILSIVAAHTP